MVTVLNDPASGLLAKRNQSNGIFETCFADNAPQQYVGAAPVTGGGGQTGAVQPLIPEQLF